MTGDFFSFILENNNGEDNDLEMTANGTNALTKIEEHDECEEAEQKQEVDTIKNINSAHTNNICNEEMDNTVWHKEKSSDDFDPLKYAIDFFTNYNSNDDQINMPLVTAQG